MGSTLFLIIALVAIGFLSFLLFLALFEPGLPYRISQRFSGPINSENFLRRVGALGNARVHRKSKIDVLTNGETFYQAELEAVRAAQQSINLEAYIFQKGKVGDLFLEALTERARAGVEVRMVLDAFGSIMTLNSYFHDLRAAGGRVAWYHPLRWYTWPRFNNRTHRELIIVDGRIGFIGGAGFADHWLTGRGKNPRWRDTVFRVEGDAVTSMQATFAENWLEASGELLVGDEYYPVNENGGTPSLIIDSSPSTGGSTRARIVYQMMLASAEKGIDIATPYFLPDRSARDEMIRAMQERNVRIRIITPGIHTDQLLTRRSSRRLYGDLLRAGAAIYEYQPSMLHVKMMVVDGIWSIVGSTNFDHRSFELNDEVNLVAYDPLLVARLEEDFNQDVARSRAVSYAAWRRRSIFERLEEILGRLLERQQ